MVIFILSVSRERKDDERNGQNTNRVKIREPSYRIAKIIKKNYWIVFGGEGKSGRELKG